MKNRSPDGRSNGSTCCAPLVGARDVEQALDLAPALRVLGDGTRLQILALLARAPGSLCACEIEAAFDLSQPTISHHLKQLRDAGLVGSERRGTWMHYSVDRDRLDGLLRDLETLTGPRSTRARRTT